ncbi:MAG TPA: hypothetical protein VIM29_12510 [Bacillota bacterium]
MNQPTTTWETELKKLDCLYEQLLKVAADPQADPEQVVALSTEADAVISGWIAKLPSRPGRDARPQLEQLQQKLFRIRRLVETERNKAFQSLKNLKAGKRAVQSYRPPTVGLGYTEGKFLDTKK